MTEITAGPDGNLWFTEECRRNQIGRITTAGVVTEFSDRHHGRQRSLRASRPGPTATSGSPRPAATRSGGSPPPASITEFPIATTAGSSPAGITAGPDGNLWFTEAGTDKIGRITPTGVDHRVPGPHQPDSAPLGHHGRARRQPLVHRGKFQQYWPAGGPRCDQDATIGRAQPFDLR